MNRMLKLFFCFLITTIYSYQSFAKDYYVNGTTGKDSNDGLTENTSFKTIQRAADLTLPGDTVYVMNGQYVNPCNDCNVVTIRNAGTIDNWITYTNYPNHRPVIKFNSWQGFQVTDGAAYVKINGFVIQGNADEINLEAALNQPGGCNNPDEGVIGTYNGNGIQVIGLSPFSTAHSHHIEITNNEIFNCSGAGISNLQSDHLTIRNNLIYDNCWYTVYGSSGITFYQNWNFSNDTAEYRMIVENNFLANNRNLVPWNSVCDITDGNGIIVDDSRNTQHGSAIGAYMGRTLIQNNIIVGSGGPAIHVYLSDNVDIINNTTYFNQQTPQLFNGEIDALKASNVTIVNNIMYAKNEKPINKSALSSDVIISNNLLFGGNGTMVPGSNSIFANPNFQHASLDINADFSIKASSQAIDNASSTLAPSIDYTTQARPIGKGPDIGAYEYR